MDNERTPRCKPAEGRTPARTFNFNLGVEIGQVGLILLVLLRKRSFRVLGVRWPRWVQAVPSYTVGSLGAFWTVQRLVVLFGSAR